MLLHGTLFMQMQITVIICSTAQLLCIIFIMNFVLTSVMFMMMYVDMLMYDGM